MVAVLVKHHLGRPETELVMERLGLWVELVVRL
jgi:hypothetical protein